jgi:RNA polymerase sigma-70 factor (ECF subfamily)
MLTWAWRAAGTTRRSPAWWSRCAGSLHAHCYRMLGSAHDADDALQEALLRAWRRLARFEGRSSLRSWLYTVATRTCLDIIEHRGKRALPVDLGPSSDRAVLDQTSLADVAWDAQLGTNGRS